MSVKHDLTGQQFSKLIVIRENGRIRKEVAWLCQCECGNEITVSAYNLRSGHTKSCGCFMKSQISNANKKHGMYGTKLYKTYYNMKNRCYNPNYYFFQHYGGKGIGLCTEWLGENGFENFYEWSIHNGYSEELSIDRIDNAKDYSPDNCRWVSMKEQQNNRTNNHILTFHNEKHTMAEWAEILNISYSKLQASVSRGKYIELMENIVNGTV